MESAFVLPVVPVRGRAAVAAGASVRAGSAAAICMCDAGGSAPRGDADAHAVAPVSRRNVLTSAMYASLMAAISKSEGAEAADVAVSKNWEKVDLPSDATVFDLDFVKGSNRGWLVGSRGSIAESSDGGKTWQARSFQNLDPEEEINYRFQKVSFVGDEGWVIGKPSILLHTRDAGKSWERVPLSPKLPGDPVIITALSPNTAELCTTAGAVYTTTNGGRNWKAQVKETIDATLNRTVSSGVSGASYFTGSIVSVLRDVTGSYLAISSRGNFYLTWEKGQDFWIPHARDSSRRIQAMGFIDNELSKGLWMATRGGGLGFTKPGVDLLTTSALDFDDIKIKTGGYAILNVAFRPDTEDVWASVGGGTLWFSKDHGKTWKRDDLVGKTGGILYDIKFFGKDKGFVLGGNGLLLRFTGI
ncbi:Photosystem II stability/assembly factor [Porphyridium purpureum]|uniref:Photosystem II stability/assembly factor n=1 Tax=Porphyridium purpureum TaxID=35688 RepID=A0A5J4Z176_PORPP|nr:Photosystem II stability/assembly factor [Porphyridium purpureum]|eukprot:POR7991..scf208_2